jgi:sporulation protein YlmC with PRC-barrel domain
MKTRLLLVTFMSLAALAVAVDSSAQTAGKTMVGITAAESKEVAVAGWSAKKQILGKDVFSSQGEKIGTIDDLIISPAKQVSYAIVGVGGFLGVGSHDVAVPVKQLKQEAGRIVLPGATKESLKAAPKFEYAK